MCFDFTTTIKLWNGETMKYQAMCDIINGKVQKSEEIEL